MHVIKLECRVAQTQTYIARAEIKDLKREKRRNRLTPKQEDTLQTLFGHGYRYPSMKMVQEVADRTGLRKPQVVQWFETQRKNSRSPMFESEDVD